MTEAPHHTFRHGGHRIGLAGAVLGIAALSGAGTVAGVLPAISTAHPRPVAAADAAVPGAAPFPRTASSPITAIFT